MYRWFLALRYLLTRPINLLGVVGVMLGVWALIVVVALFSGFLQVIEAHVRSANADLSVLYLPHYARWPQLLPLLEQDPNVAAAAPRMVHSGLLHRPGHRPDPLPLPGRGALQGGDGPFVNVLGVDPGRERGVTGFADWIADPTIPEPLRVRDAAAPLGDVDGLPAILLGQERMQRSGLRPGDRLRLTSGIVAGGEAGHSNALREVHTEFVVAGAFHTQHALFDGLNVFVHIDQLRRLLRPDEPEAVLECAVAAKDDALLPETAERLQRSLRTALGLADARFPQVLTWRQREHLLLGSVEHQRGLMKVVLFLIMVPAAVLILATLLMMVGEKAGDIGILTAMGSTAGGVMQLFLCCGLVITAAGVLLGVVTGCLSAIHLDDFHRFLQADFGIDLFPSNVYNLDRVPYALEPWWIALVAGLAMLVGAVVSALPAWLAARHDPLQSLRGL